MGKEYYPQLYHRLHYIESSLKDDLKCERIFRLLFYPSLFKNIVLELGPVPANRGDHTV